MKFLLISLLISIISLHCNAQEPDSIQQNITYFLELGVSANAYRGDLTIRYEKWTQAIHVGMKLSRKKRLNGYIGLTIGKVTGENINYTYETNKFFVTNFIIFNYDLKVNIITREFFVLYLSQGIGLMRFTPKDKDNNDLASNPDTRAKEESKQYRNISFLFPQTIGAIYIFNNHYGVGLQIGLLNQSTDYVDNISLLSDQKIRDNILQYRFILYAPIKF